MKNCHSELIFDFPNEIEFVFEEEVPEVIYRYFDTEEDRQNFLDGIFSLKLSSAIQNIFLIYEV